MGEGWSQKDIKNVAEKRDGRGMESKGHKKMKYTYSACFGASSFCDMHRKMTPNR
uniref:Uncharacterized protein n=1 Tax=Arundo donax TaxID=35708 RepID=A0A0A9EJJ8_ARUDO